ncbi:tyrosine-type recombinase/integrase [Peribacillus sp. NPDC076916]|uniref:tyrosine-type recombinase/integrase n=1 Tax=Peribacillus sp. NPDC076916 TaxID=3390608 RepID=UPI003D020F48
MTKKKESLTVDVDLSDLFIEDSLKKKSVEGFPVNQALATVTRQMEVTGFRERTISDYNLHVTHFTRITGVQVLDEITPEHIYEWLSSMNVSNQTKLTRLKCLKAFLGRCFDIGWISTKFWKSITIKVDSPVKIGASEKDIRLLLTLLDLSDFVHLRDATAVLLMYQTGIRVGTLALLENKHVDLNAKLLKIDGGIIKNHQQILLPIDGDLIRLLTVLMSQNDLVRRDHRIRNNFVFITKNGGPVTTSPSNNNIQKRLSKYAKEYGLKNINPHALRRGFAKKLLDRGANVAVISRALGHSDIAVTSRYLHLDKEEVAESLRKYL